MVIHCHSDFKEKLPLKTCEELANNNNNEYESDG